ncbi:MAG TPA: AEC family transporter [Pseudogracilibacillus sp.]|nr:AEC family transporter [Pseudogracilibacillus sp.]
MGNLIQEMVVLYSFALLGYAAFKCKVLNKDSHDVLSSIILKITLPCLIIHSLDKPFEIEMLKEFIYLLSLSLYILTASVLLASWMGNRMRDEKRKRAAYESLIIFGNQGFIGYAVVYTLFGEDGIVYVVIFNIFYLILIWTYGIYLFNRASDVFTYRRLFNAGLISTLLGIIILLLPFSLPLFVTNMLEEIGNMTIPLSMIMIGSLIATVKGKELLVLMKNTYIWLAVLAKLILIPLLLFPFIFFPSYPQLLIIACLVSAMPSATTSSLYAQQYGGDAQFASVGVALSTMLSLVTIPVFILLLTSLLKG